MKRLLIAAIVLGFAASTAGATSVSISPTELDDLYEVKDNPVGNATVTQTSGASYDVVLTGSNGTFSQAQVGMDFPDTYNWGYGDLSGNDSFVLGITNDEPTGGDNILVNLFINTGWTDSPWSMTDQYNENTWDWIAPGETKWFTLDISSLGTTTNYEPEPDETVNRIEWVSALGFNVGTNILDTEVDAYDISSGETLSLTVVPEPISMVMLGALGAGMLGARGIRRRRK